MEDLIRQMQEFAVIAAVSPSVVRGQPKGVQHAIQSCLIRIDLNLMPKKLDVFNAWLNNETDCILDAIEGTAKCRPWGTARKALNLFLRDCLYHHYLRKKFDFKSLEEFLEIPLDSVVANALKRDAGRGQLPLWPGLKKLTPEVSDRFQRHAGEMACRLNLKPKVHLDIYLWLQNR